MIVAKLRLSSSLLTIDHISKLNESLQCYENKDEIIQKLNINERMYYELMDIFDITSQIYSV